MIIYVAYFLEKPEKSVVKWQEIQNQHITLAFKPDKEASSKLLQLPKKIKVKIVGYGCDEYNEGYLVQNEIINSIVEIPHISLAVNNGGKPVNTAQLKFNKIPEKEIITHLGYFSDDGKVYIIGGD